MTERVTVEFAWRAVGDVVLDGAKLRFPDVDSSPGIYRFDLQSATGTTTYIGQTDQLQRRFQHYRTPGPSQATNVRLNKLVLDLLAVSGSAQVSTCTTASIETSRGHRQPLDLVQQPCRVLLEHVALVSVVLEGHRVENL